MTRMPSTLIRTILALAAGGAILFAGEPVSRLQGGGWTSAAEARIGRPLTPMSYAGVARRTTRRAVAVGAAGGAYGAYGAYGAPSCTQVVDAYGRVYTQCP